MFRRILVPLDGSELAERALPYAQGLARELNSELILLRVVNCVDLASSQAFTGFLPAEVFDAAIEDERQTAAEYLARLAERLQADGLATQWVVRSGDPAGEIVEYGKMAQIDLVVMSTHGRSGLSRWVYGSVADRVLRGGTLPVLLIRAMNSEANAAQLAAVRQSAPARR
jgi:nucleotide-binding universal stress UspA family protein